MLVLLAGFGMKSRFEEAFAFGMKCGIKVEQLCTLFCPENLNNIKNESKMLH